MPRYYFHVLCDGLVLDDEGQELPDHDAAWQQATKMSACALLDLGGNLRPGHHWQMDVADDASKVLFRLVISAEYPGDQ